VTCKLMVVFDPLVTSHAIQCPRPSRKSWCGYKLQLWRDCNPATVRATSCNIRATFVQLPFDARKWRGLTAVTIIRQETVDEFSQSLPELTAWHVIISKQDRRSSSAKNV